MHTILYDSYSLKVLALNSFAHMHKTEILRCNICVFVYVAFKCGYSASNSFADCELCLHRRVNLINEQRAHARMRTRYGCEKQEREQILTRLINMRKVSGNCCLKKIVRH